MVGTRRPACCAAGIWGASIHVTHLGAQERDPSRLVRGAAPWGVENPTGSSIYTSAHPRIRTISSLAFRYSNMQTFGWHPGTSKWVHVGNTGLTFAFSPPAE